MKAILTFVLLGLAIFAPDAKALTCFNVYTVYDYYTNGVYTHTGIESSGINCYEDGVSSSDPWPNDDEEQPIGPDDDPAEPAICTTLRNTIENGCNVASPPPVVVNGCTGVPAALIVQGVAASQFGDIFTEACNSHDRCYSVNGASKTSCDVRIGEEMIEIAQETIPANQWSFYEPFVRFQAEAYASSLYNNFLWLPQILFDAAQKEAACRAVSSAMHQAGCVI